MIQSVSILCSKDNETFKLCYNRIGRYKQMWTTKNCTYGISCFFFFQTSTKKYQEKTTHDNDDSEEDSVTVSYKSNRTALPAGPSDQGATAILETETEKDKDAQALFEKAQKINEVCTFSKHQSS